MLTYNTHRKRLVLPEYGRNLQKMVDHCLTIENREERNRCALTIVKAMEQLFPELRQPENANKVWDHLAIMSDFKLDIDYPQEVVKQEELNSQPAKVPYEQSPIRFRHYGKILEEMIDRAAGMEEGPAKDEVVLLIANHMKKQLLAVNPEGADDQRVFADLAVYSKGAIRLNPEEVKLFEFEALPIEKPTKKKRKRR